MSSVNPVAGQTTNSPDAENKRTNPLADESTFLLLLVSQMQNQNPLDPVDSNQFVSQLTQYSQLEQLIGIHKDTTSLDKTLGGDMTSGSTNPSSTGAQ
jgi:flagellar basal-body rod modification protein FlgD